MSHPWRGLTSAVTEERYQYHKRRVELRKKLEDVPFDQFTPGELWAVLRLFGLAYKEEPGHEDFKILEKKVKEMKKVKKKPARKHPKR